MQVRTFSVLLLLAQTAWAAAGAPVSAGGWLEANVWKRITLAGSRQLGLHLERVSGDHSAYQSLNFYGQGNQTFTDFGQMQVTGRKVLGLFNFNLQFADSRYQDPLASRFSLDYASHGLSVDAGDITGTLASGNQFLNFSRQLWGASVKYTSGRGAFAVLHSTAHSSTQTFSFNGNGSSGPYYLRDSRIIPDSVKVQVDGKDLVFPNDFTVDSIIGAINFTNRTIPATSTIVVSYESMGINGGDSTIDGISGMYDLGRFGEIGFAAARQIKPGSNSLATVDDRYMGYGDPSTPYFLQYVPLTTAPLTVRVDGIIQTLGIDYYFSPNNPVVFYFKRYIPSTSTVDVFYTPQPTTSLSGNRDDYGFNYRLGLGRRGRDGVVSYSQAWSSLTSPAGTTRGLARGITADYRLKDYHFTMDLSSIPDGFVGIQDATFLRNAQSSQLGLTYQHKGFSWSLGTMNASVASQTSNASGQPTYTHTRSVQTNGNIAISGKDNSRWSLTDSQVSSESPSGNSDVNIADLSYSKPLGRLNLNFDLNRTAGTGPIATATSTTVGSVLSTALQFRPTYQAGRGFAFGLRAGLSQNRIGSQSAAGQDISFNASYRSPRNRWSDVLTYDISNSGQIASLGTFISGSAAGYNGNGFSGGYNGSSSYGGAFNAGGANIHRFSNSVTCSASSKLNLGATASWTEQSGTDSSLSRGFQFGLSASYDLGRNQNVIMSLEQNNVDYPTSFLSSDSTSLSMNLNGSPKGPWNYMAGMSVLLTHGGSFAQSSLQWQLNVRHRLHRNQALIFDLSTGNVFQYQAQNSLNLSLGYEYQLFKNVALVGKYRIQNVVNLDPTVTSGAYSARGFDFELDFHFGGY